MWQDGDSIEMTLVFAKGYWRCEASIEHGGDETTWITTSDELSRFLSAISACAPWSWHPTSATTEGAST